MGGGEKWKPVLKNAQGKENIAKGKNRCTFKGGNKTDELHPKVGRQQLRTETL